MTGFRLLSMVCIVMIFSMDQMLTTATISCTNGLRQKGHTICSKDSPQLKSSSMSEKDKKTILDLHNKLRGNVKPKATNMPKLYWDNNLAAVAQKKANQCKMQHDTYPQRAIAEYGVTIGQNLAAGQHDWTEAINDWHSEVKDFAYGIGKKKPSAVIGHYTQVVHSYAVRVGCGYAECSTGLTRFFACNYATGQGPVKKPYETGAKCSKCPDTCTNGLCDCKGKLCKNGGKLDLNKCTCECTRIYSGSECENLNCNVKDETHCSQWNRNYCTKYANVPGDCPHMCGLCGA